ncbi:F0F1 ATP synthase subunit B family protein [Nocardia goodfellowii]|uniref:ATP synthase subunit b n=1 Tax=Nocardia goodfellowii TaxID=882446 RepID=A0ABS4QDE7_9NOCA|nr:F0F1 ATP synthase subunit B [Nocardia goodfellowii]MBP2189583.1 F-type H+-transporting ATPase subunit b [Nocardia goodfellowii]
MSTKNTAGENFLLPNGTFFAELLIFLTVLGVIWRFVVPPIHRVLAEREARTAQTAVDQAAAKQARAEAEAAYQAALAEARVAATGIRKQARDEGQSLIKERRAAAQGEADAQMARSLAELRANADQVNADLRTTIDPLAQALADRVLGAETSGAGKG